MADKHKIGIIGCGDYIQRWEAPVIKRSCKVAVKSLFDLDAERARKLASAIGGRVVEDAEVILQDGDIDIVLIYVPPFVRKDLIKAAAKAGKNILTTKPLAPNVKDGREIVDAVKKGRVKCGVFYRRSGNACFEMYKNIFQSGEIGKLALYKQDWIHHYPQWAGWALDPKKNGGPFMDAMIHNMNIARYLMGRKATYCTFFADSHAHKLPCADTEFMKLDFAGSGSAHLFITWAADLAVYSMEGNDREHIDITYMVTDKGWRLTEEQRDGQTIIVASKEGKRREWQVQPLAMTPYDEFAEAVEKGGPLPSDIITVKEAYEDVKIYRDAERSAGRRTAVKLS